MPEEIERVFSNRRGQSIPKEGLSKKDLLRESLLMGYGSFPYKVLDKRYEACESFNIFKGKQRIINPIDFKYASLLKYTFGLEFETSMGYVPEEFILRDGLIPLRDGSITGIEYSTVILEGANGLNLLKQEVETLKKYTAFNKECSLHIHLGGFPLRAKKTFNLYKICWILQQNRQITNLVPKYTLQSGKYKKNGKDYCISLPEYRCFEDLYHALVGKEFEGSFRQPHPQDPDRGHKWQIHTRYYWLNFINFLCYNVNKTIEFRLLRPTFNIKKIMNWIYIFNAILMYAEKVEDANKLEIDLTLDTIVDSVYPKEFADLLKLEIIKLGIEVENQTRNEDYNGSCLQFENVLFPEDKLL